MITKVAHTIGPWRVMRGSINFPPLLVRASQTDKAIADCDYQDGEEGAANARLIAAAPEMLEALEQTLSHLNSSDATHDRNGRKVDTSMLRGIVRDAIAKTKGE